MRVIYINPDAPGAGDDAARYNSFAFPESPERFRTVIYDLGSERTLSEIGSMHSARPVRFYAYTFKDKELPEKEDWRGQMSFDHRCLKRRNQWLSSKIAKVVAW